MELVFEAQWSDYEECGSVQIWLDEHGDLFSFHDGYSVYSESGRVEGYWSMITWDEAMEIIDDWSEYYDGPKVLWSADC